MELLRVLLTDYQDRSKFLFFIALILLSYLVSFVLFHIVNYTSNKAERHITESYKICLLEKNKVLKNLDINSFSKEDRFLTGEEDVLKHTNQILKCITIITDFITIPFYIAYGFYINPAITVSTILITAIVGLINNKYTKSYCNSIEEYYES